MNRQHDLDALRAFAMLLGIVFHAALFLVSMSADKDDVVLRGRCAPY